MLRYFLFLIGLFTFLHSAEITTPPTQFPDYTQQVFLQTASCFIGSTNQIVYSWSDNISQAPWYAIYDVATKNFSTPPTQIAKDTYSFGAYYGVFCCYNSKQNQVVFSWEDNTVRSFEPWYAIYDVATKKFSTLPTKIPFPLQVDDMVYCCYNLKENKVVLSWIDYIGDKNPWYAILDENGNVSEPIKLSSNRGGRNLFCCSTDSDEIVFSYSNQAQTEVKGAILSLNTGAITPLPAINYSFDGFLGDVFCSYDSSKHQVFLSFATVNISTILQPFYIAYDLNTSSYVTSNPILISNNTYSSSEPYVDIFSCYNSIDKQMIFSWGEIQAGNVYYAIYDTSKSNFSLPASLISSSYSNSIRGYGVFPCYNSLTNQVFFTWCSDDINSSGYNPWYAIYTSPLPTSYTLKALNRFSPLKMQR